MVLKTVTYVEHDEPTTATELIKTGEVMAFVGPDFIVTVRHGEHCGLHRVREKLEADPEQLALGPAAVLHAIADHIVDQYVRSPTPSRRTWTRSRPRCSSRARRWTPSRSTS